MKLPSADEHFYSATGLNCTSSEGHYRRLLELSQIALDTQLDTRLIRMSVHAGYVASRQQDSPDLNNAPVLMYSAPPWIAITPEDEGDSAGDVGRPATAVGDNTKVSTDDWRDGSVQLSRQSVQVNRL